MTQLIALDNIDSDEVDSLIALATNNATLNGTATLGVATETVSLPTFETVVSSVLEEQAKIQASDLQADDDFGYSVSISSDGLTAIVGALYEDTGGTSAGAAYIFVRSGTSWTQQAKIQSSDKGAGDAFGISVSISGDGNTAIVGAIGDRGTDGQQRGAAYIFVRSGTTWTQQAKIQASVVGTRYGAAVSISSDGNTALVGDYGDVTPVNSWTGAAYIHIRSGTTWSQQARITDNTSASAFFGNSLSMSGDGLTATVGVGGEGAIYVFAKSGSTWPLQARITDADIVPTAYGSTRVSLSSDGNTLIAGVQPELGQPYDGDANYVGAAYIFVRSGTTWTRQAKIQASDKQASDGFGYSVSISSDGLTAIVGALNEDTGGSNTGAAYIFTISGTSWTEIQKIQASDLQAEDKFGNAVSISSDGKTAIVAAYIEDPAGISNAGAAYIFTGLPIETPLFDISQSSIFVHDTATENFTANFTNVPTVDNRTISTALIIPQDATGYLPTTVQIDGESQVILWQNSAAPVPSINASDVVRFTLLRSGGTWSVLGAVNKFGSV